MQFFAECLGGLSQFLLELRSLRVKAPFLLHVLLQSDLQLCSAAAARAQLRSNNLTTHQQQTRAGGKRSRLNLFLHGGFFSSPLADTVVPIHSQR